MLKRFIALAIASTGFALAASFYAGVARPSGVFAVTTSDVLTSRGKDADEIAFSNWVDGISGRSGISLTQARPPRTPLDDDYIAYRHIFAFIYSEAHRKESQNQDVNTAARFFKDSVPLSDDEASVLEKIALETETKTLAIEEQAATIIRRFREKIDAELKSGRGLSLEPPELQTLQEQRVKTTLQGRDELRKALGESTFSKFHTYLKEGLNLRIDNAIPSPQKN